MRKRLYWVIDSTGRGSAFGPTPDQRRAEQYALHTDGDLYIVSATHVRQWVLRMARATRAISDGVRRVHRGRS